MRLARGSRSCALLAWGLFAMLAGCVSTRPIDETTPPPNESGVVALKVVSDGYYGAGDLTRFIVSARVRRDAAWTTSGASRVRLARGRAATHSSVTLGGVVEPGVYSLVSLELTQGQYSFEDDALRFEVRPGATTLLGTLIFHGRGLSLKRLPGDAASLDAVEQSFPTLLGNQAVKRELVLQVSSTLPDARPLTSELKKNVRLADDWFQLENGDFAAPGRLGTVLYRQQGSSRRRVIDVGDWREVLSVASLHKGLLVAGEEGLLRLSPDGGATWQALSPPARGLIRAVRSTGQDSVAAVVRTDARWAVYVTSDVFSGAWRRVAEFTFENLPAGDEQRMPWAVQVPNGFGLMHMRGVYRHVDLTGKIRESSLQFPDIPTRRHLDQIGQMRETTKGQVQSLTATRDGLLQLKKHQAVGTSVSADDGMSWSDLKLPYGTLVVALQDRRTFYAIATSPGNELVQQFATYVSHDAGASWGRSGPSPVGPGQALRFWATSEGTLQIELADGDVLQSLDAGSTWARLSD